MDEAEELLQRLEARFHNPAHDPCDCHEIIAQVIKRAEQRGKTKAWVTQVCGDIEHHDKMQKDSYNKGLLRGAEILETYKAGKSVMISSIIKAMREEANE